ncbi:hypothetical protein SDC9_149882 [bioreactor metagenome]|uniref:Uncharacterized protein n=1 Tax=bioreactor metagenome TaxID=1076179 RepID=A0A645EMJ8_9ZZZZ
MGIEITAHEHGFTRFVGIGDNTGSHAVAVDGIQTEMGRDKAEISKFGDNKCTTFRIGGAAGGSDFYIGYLRCPHGRFP